MKNDYRSGKKVLHLVVEEGLHLAVKCVAADQGLSITEFVTSILEREVGYGDAGVGPADFARVGETGGVVGSLGGGDCGGDSQSGLVGRVDWDSLMVQGAVAKASAAYGVAVDKTLGPLLASNKTYSGVDIPILDPIEEIA